MNLPLKTLDAADFRRNRLSCERRATAPGPDDDARCAARLLIVSDDPAAAENLRLAVDPQTYGITSATTGAEALARYNEAPFDLVVLDIELPDISGIDIVHSIRLAPFDTRILITSARANIDSAIAAIKLGVNDYLRKPYAIDGLILALDRMSKQQARDRQTRHLLGKFRSGDEPYRYMIENSPDLVFTVDARGHITFANRQAELVLGFTANELYGRHYSYIVDNRYAESAESLFRERRAGERAYRDVEMAFRTFNHIYRQKKNAQPELLVSCSARGMYRDGNRRRPEEYLGTYCVARNITEHKRSEEAMLHRAYHDVLTGMPNRVLLQDRANVAIFRAQRAGTAIAVMFIDLDGFKAVNDSFGHASGDQLLKEAAQRLAGCLRRSDTLARIGGDEFGVLLPDIYDRMGVQIIANKCLRAFETPFVIGEQQLTITASIGIALYPEDGEVFEPLLDTADCAMYQVKARQKNGYAFFTPESAEDDDAAV